MEVHKGPTELELGYAGIERNLKHTSSLFWLHSVPIIPPAIDHYLYDFITRTS